jgi:exonuclease SbcC
MILDSLYLKNIRSYKELDIVFQKGTTLFEGDIGSGKSTILMAIEFALFGLGNIRGNSLLRTGEKEGLVRLGFTVNKDSFQVQRKLVAGQKSARQSSDGCHIKTEKDTLYLSPTELKAKVLDILNFNEPTNPRAKSVIFTYAVFTPQE